MAQPIVTVEGRRVYVALPYGHPAKDAIKSLGAHWDPTSKCWWLTSAKRAEVEALLQREGAGFDLRKPEDRAIRADQLEEQGRTQEAAELRKPAPQQDAHEIRLTGKGEYKGKTYYLGSRTRDGRRVRCLTLPGADGRYLDFWADADQVRVVKTYQPREVWDGRRYSGRTRTQHTTLGSIADFLERQKDPQTRRVQCLECGSWHNEGEECRDCGGC